MHAIGVTTREQRRLKELLVKPKEIYLLHTDLIVVMRNPAMLHKFAIINVHKILNYHNSNKQIDFLRKRYRNTIVIISVTVWITTFKSN